MDIQRISSWDDLGALRSGWNMLTDGVPFRRWEWLATWWKYYGDAEPRKKQLFVLAVYDEDLDDRDGTTISNGNTRHLIGIAPWILRHSPVVGTTIEFLGEEEICSDHLTVLSDPLHSQRVAWALADYLATEFRDWDILNLYGIDENDSMAESFFDAMRRLGFENPIYRHAYQTWRIHLPESWEEYLRMLSKSHRRHNRQTIKRVHQAGNVAFQIAWTKEAFDTIWPVLETLHQKRWTRCQQSGCFASTRFTAFHREAAPMMLESGNLRLSMVEVNQTPIAVEYGLMGSKTTYAYQSGIDPDSMDLEPGRLGNIMTIQQAIEENHTTFDFLRGDEPYKWHWCAEPMQAWHVRVANRHAIARLRNASWRAKQWLKAKVKQCQLVSVSP